LQERGHIQTQVLYQYARAHRQIHSGT
jgi:hypothetical protein